MQWDLVLKGGTCVLPAGQTQADVAIAHGTIVAIGNLDAKKAKKVIDASNLHVLPGVIDSQVHFREPGNEHKEDLESGTRSAALGGVTAIFEMPNTKPPTTSPEALNDKLKRAKGRAWCDYSFFIGGTDLHASWADLEKLPGCCGIKIFMGSSTGNLLVAEDKDIREIFTHSSRRIAVHCEDEFRLRERFKIAEDAGHPKAHPDWRDTESAIRATRRILRIAAETGHRVHVLHVTTAPEIELLGKHKQFATVECTPQHLTLSAPECYERIGTYAQMNPPIRSAIHREGLWRGIANGIVDVIGSDHAPHTHEEKAQPYPKSPSGMPGVQTLVPIMLNHVNNGKLSLERFVDLTAHGPQRIYNIARKGRIAVGYDADFTIVDMKAKRTIKNDMMASKCGWTPFDGMEVTGWPIHTIIRGNQVMAEDELLDRPIGEQVAFQDTLQPKNILDETLQAG